MIPVHETVSTPCELVWTCSGRQAAADVNVAAAAAAAATVVLVLLALAWQQRHECMYLSVVILGTLSSTVGRSASKHDRHQQWGLEAH